MKHYNLNGAERGCYDCGMQYLQCICWNKPKAIINKTPIYLIGEKVQLDGVEGEIIAVRYPVYTTDTSWTGAPVIVTDYEVRFPDESTDWFCPSLDL